MEPAVTIEFPCNGFKRRQSCVRPPGSRRGRSVVEMDDGRWFDGEKHQIEAFDFVPIGVLGGLRLGVRRGDRGLYLI